MRTLDYEAILRNVYEYFVAAKQPPGVIDGRVCYHQGIAGDPLDIDRPCAIGLFDNQHLLNDPEVATMDVETLFVSRPDVLRHIFKVDRLTREDAVFLAAVQNKHDFHAMDASHRPWRPLDVFQAERLDGLEFIARDFDLQPVLAF